MLGTALITSTPVWSNVPLPTDRIASCQQTLAKTIRCIGVGVHSGESVSMAIKPAAINTGYVFVRTDVAHHNRIEAIWSNVTDTSMCTKITNAHGVSISTIEHIIAALAGMHIHNAAIEVGGPEVPIMDGSSADFVTLIQAVGIKRQNAPLKIIRVLKPIQVSHGTGTAFLLPADERRFSMEFNFAGRMAETSFLSYYPDSDDFVECLADSRTFGFFEDAQKLQAAGLAKGASLQNTIVIGEAGVMNEGGLRHNDEFVRHKVLDAVGDLALAGGVLLAHFDGINSGHGLNNQLLRALFADPSAWELVDPKDQLHSNWGIA
ncbi:UDP-3-O-acyl-N-acetylglucosamine deacetylase [Candidatus Odyssella acanthamoebae]|uniref:UDP-3-O-acyl-N-acetylglucosamine deacetylase n=1 Tax=Candidatus Odyssella acanthamoebae TaxID=91604 RepID=UPI000691F48B|nr:UDP-3-O-acyl-N-acetylglucosamine deacetylase [Candidatus Paracaedibacter acanthamoebae]